MMMPQRWSQRLLRLSFHASIASPWLAPLAVAQFTSLGDNHALP